ncbi:MAG: hypothetical protein QOC92_3714 [Acidimicrobiaceae bacterium]|jgi:hypothetical protein
MPKIGTRLYSATCDAEVIVVRAPSTDVEITCGGAPMTQEADPSRGVASGSGDGAPLGKRFEDADTGLELLITKGGAGQLALDGRLLVQKEPKRLPASD